MKRLSNQEFKNLEAYWYTRLKDFDFEDIENTSLPDRPLKTWHSTKYSSQRSRLRQGDREKYNQMLDSFINHYSFHEVCALISKPKKCSIRDEMVAEVLELHRGGLSERKIAKKLKKSKTAVNRILAKSREWMRIT